MYTLGMITEFHPENLSRGWVVVMGICIIMLKVPREGRAPKRNSDVHGEVFGYMQVQIIKSTIQ